eukprot:gb/GECH01001291.1/.p1 GENE.gb/GECH01001291.1/~~gb/GECH01001291.1/.p1  ORF type:complete len:787 (+),score=117.88 gb/GECH01001291.1/:1-2361(+)
MHNLSLLPAEVLGHVFSYLHVFPDLYSISQTCLHFRETLMVSPNLWYSVRLFKDIDSDFTIDSTHNNYTPQQIYQPDQNEMNDMAFEHILSLCHPYVKHWDATQFFLSDFEYAMSKDQLQILKMRERANARLVSNHLSNRSVVNLIECREKYRTPCLESLAINLREIEDGETLRRLLVHFRNVRDISLLSHSPEYMADSKQQVNLRETSHTHDIEVSVNLDLDNFHLNQDYLNEEIREYEDHYINDDDDENKDDDLKLEFESLRIPFANQLINDVVLVQILVLTPRLRLLDIRGCPLITAYCMRNLATVIGSHLTHLHMGGINPARPSLLNDKALYAISRECPNLELLECFQCPRVSHRSIERVLLYLNRLHTLRLTGCQFLDLWDIQSALEELIDQTYLDSNENHLDNKTNGPRNRIISRAADEKEILEALKTGIHPARLSADIAPRLRLDRLRVLQLNEALMNDLFLEGVLTLAHPSLSDINVNGCGNLTDTAIVQLAHLCGETLRHLRFDYSNTSDASVATVAQSCPSLRTFVAGPHADVEHILNRFTDDAVAALSSGCPLLEEVSVRHGQYTPAILAMLARGTPQLQALTLSSSQFLEPLRTLRTESIPVMHAVRHLDLGRTSRVGDEDVALVVDLMPHLTFLRLSYTDVTGSVIPLLSTRLSDLERLELDHCVSLHSVPTLVPPSDDMPASDNLPCPGPTGSDSMVGIGFRPGSLKMISFAGSPISGPAVFYFASVYCADVMLRRINVDFCTNVSLDVADSLRTLENVDDVWADKPTFITT